MFNNRFLIPIITAVSAITIGGAALAYNMSKPKENKIVQNASISSIVSATSSQSSASNISKNSSSISNSNSSTSSTSSNNSSNQIESKDNENKTENQNQAVAQEVANLNNSEAKSKQYGDYKSTDNCSLPDKAGFDVLLTQKGCLYFNQKIDTENGPRLSNINFNPKVRAKLMKALQDIAGIEYDQNYEKFYNKFPNVEIMQRIMASQKEIYIGFVDFPPDFRGDGSNYGTHYKLFEDRNGNWSYQKYNLEDELKCTLSPTITTQIIRTQYRCLEFPKDLFSDPSYSFLNSFGAKNKSKLQEAVIQATVEFYEANYGHALVQFPNISVINQYPGNQITFILSDSLPNCSNCDGNAMTGYYFEQNLDGSWRYENKVNAVTPLINNCPEPFPDTQSLITGECYKVQIGIVQIKSESERRLFVNDNGWIKYAGADFFTNNKSDVDFSKAPNVYATKFNFINDNKVEFELGMPNSYLKKPNSPDLIKIYTLEFFDGNIPVWQITSIR